MIVSLEEAARRLRGGEVVAYPTETVYALGVDATSAEAVRRVLELKGRDPSRVLPVLITGLDAVESWVPELPACAERLARRFWPGPLTLVIGPARRQLATVADRGRVGFRCSPHPTAAALARSTGCPLVATSCNRSGAPPCRDIHEVENLFGATFPVAGGAPAGARPPSTVLAVSADGTLELLREGALSRRELMECLAA
ncbi:MAG: L-threonylcarbamoyladenylate synthase [Myxococcota bacterium]